MKPSRFSILRSRALYMAGLLTLSSGPAMGADFFWDGRNSSSAVVTSWGDIQGWSTVQAGGTTPAALPGVNDTVVFRADNIKTGALTVTLDGLRAIQGFKTNRYTTSPVTYSQEATTTISASAGGSNVIQLHGIPTSTAGRTFGIQHDAGGLTLGTSEFPVNITIHSPHQTWHSNVVGGTSGAPGAAAVGVNGNISGGIGDEITLALTGQNTGTVINGSISNGISSRFNVEVAGTTSSVWTFNGANTYSGSTAIKSGTLRLTRADAISLTALNAGLVSVDSSNATLALRVGPGTFSADDITRFAENVVYTNAGSLALDTVNSAAEVNGGLKGIAVFKKTGANSLILNGPNTYTSTTAFRLEQGNIAIRSTTGVFAGTGANVAGKVNVVTGNTGNSALLALVGPTGMPEEEVPLIANMTTSTASNMINIGLSTAAGDGTYKGGLFGARKWVKGDPGTLTLLGNRTDTGGVYISGGTLRVISLPASSGAAPFGIYDTADKLTINGGSFMYAGPALTTDRSFSINSGGTLDSSGYGPLVWAGAGPTHIGTTARTLTLSGYALGENKISGNLTNAGSGALSITKQGAADWTLEGTNTHTGATRNNGGLLTLDYSNGGNPIGTGAVQLNAGEILVKGNSEGVSKTISTFQLGVAQHAAGVLRFQDKVNLTITTLAGGGQTQRCDLIDISGDPSNSITVGTAQPAISVVNGVLQANTATPSNGRANIILKDKDDTYGFPTLSGGNLVKASLVDIPASSTVTFGSVTTNYRVPAGEYTSTGPLLFHTITLDATTGPVVLNLNRNEMRPSSSGKGVLVTGGNKVTINSPSGSDSNNQPIWFHNYLSGADFEVRADYDKQYVFFGGSGFSNYFGNLQQTDNFHVHGSLTRISKEHSLSALQGNFRVSSGGVLELGAKFFRLDIFPVWNQVHFNKKISTDTGGIAFYGDSGLSAYATDPVLVPKRIVNFSTPTSGAPISQDLVWGTAWFLTQPNSQTDGDYSFKLSSPRANITVEIRNKIDLNGRSRRVDVAQGAAEIDAELSGVLSGGDAAGLIKAGLGTLKLSAVNTYTGETRVQEGELRVGPGNLHPDSSVAIITTGGGSGKLHVTGDVTVAAVTIDGVPQGPGRVTRANVIIGDGALFVEGALTPYQEWALANDLEGEAAAPDFDADSDGTKNVIEYAVGTDPNESTPSVLTQVPGTPAAVRFNRAGERTDLNLYLEANSSLTGEWTILATSTGGQPMGSSVGVSAEVTESGGVVTVEDKRTPTPAKHFYRLRAELQ